MRIPENIVKITIS